MEDILLSGKWKQLIKLHTSAKRLYLLSEEYGLGLQSFIQPMKEMKDAYEHICRAYARYYENENSLSEEDRNYIETNFNKAISHEYRGLFDTVDYLSISLRTHISNILEGYTYKELVEIYPEYSDIAIRLVAIPKEIADLRNSKDIGDSNMDILLKKYDNIINELCDFYMDLVSNIGKQ